MRSSSSSHLAVVTVIAAASFFTCKTVFCHGWQSASNSNSFVWRPSKVQLDQVWQSYPDTLWRKLFSSVPRRPYALSNVTLTIEGGQLLVIQGASSSGKSTILRLVAGEEQPVQGRVVVTAERDETTATLLSARPVSLGQKEFPYSSYYDEGSSMEEILNKVISQELKPPPPQQAAQSLAAQLCHICELSKSSSELNLNQLSPSEFYRWGLVIASLQSVLPCAVTADADDSLNVNIFLQVPAPVLLLDEWMDLETSGIVRNVESSLMRLAQLGAVIICVTHKPHLFGMKHPTITMCRGEILSQE